MNEFIRYIIIFFTLMSYNMLETTSGSTPKSKLRSHTTESPEVYRKSSLEKHNTPSEKLMDNNNLSKRTRAFNGDIIYPGTDFMNSKLSEKCVYGLCTGVNNYPKEKIEKLLNKTGLVNEFYNDADFIININNRFNSDSEEESLCETKQQLIYPEKGKNTNNIETIIVNVEGHKQGIVFETCLENAQCKFSETFPTGYSSTCKQKFIRRRLMTFNAEEEIVSDIIQIPSCCICTVKKTN